MSRTQMHTPNDLLSANSLGDPGPSSVDESHNVTALRTRLTHDGHLRARVDERFHGLSVHFAVNVQHDDLTETFRSVLHCRLHVALHIL